MNPSVVHSVLLRLPLKLNGSAIAKTIHLLSEELGCAVTDNPSATAQIYAALAIALEMEAASIAEPLSSSGPLTTEDVMVVLDRTTVDAFVECVSRMVNRLRQAPGHLLTKVSRLQLCYSLFGKFERLVEQFAGDEFHAEVQELMAVGWLLYLYFQRGLPDAEDVSKFPGLLLTALQIASAELKIESKLDLDELFRREFGSNFDNSQNEFARKMAEEVMKDNKRFKTSSHEASARNQLSEQLTRNLSRAIKKTNNQNFEQVNQLKFLKLKASERRLNAPNSAILSSKIDFDTCEYQNRTDESHKKETTDFSRFKPVIVCNSLFGGSNAESFSYSPSPNKTQMTPFTKTLCEYAWLTKRTISENTSMRLEELLSSISVHYQQQFEEVCLGKLTEMLHTYCHGLHDPSQRATRILRLFEFFVVEIGKGYSVELRRNLVSSGKYLFNLLCLISSIALFVDRVHPNNFKEFCACFDSTYLQVFRLINKVGKLDPNMPVSIRQHLSDLEKEMLLVSIWEDGEGFKIIARQHQTCSEFERTLQNRLQKYLYDRIFEVHRLVQLDLDTLEKTKAILAYVLNERPALLKNNYIDQIVICSIFAALKLNPATSSTTLEELFQKYVTLPMSFNSHKYEAKDLNGREVSLLEFYNGTFSQQIKGILLEHYTGRKFLLTPIKQELLRRVSGAVGTPLTQILQHTPSDSTFFRKPLNFEEPHTESDHSYQNKLRRKINVIVVNSQLPACADSDRLVAPASPELLEEELETGCKTPIFPKLQLESRAFSFGKPDDEPQLKRMTSSKTFSIFNPSSEQSEKEDE